MNIEQQMAHVMDKLVVEWHNPPTNVVVLKWQLVASSWGVVGCMECTSQRVCIAMCTMCVVRRVRNIHVVFDSPSE